MYSLIFYLLVFNVCDSFSGDAVCFCIAVSAGWNIMNVLVVGVLCLEGLDLPKWSPISEVKGLE